MRLRATWLAGCAVLLLAGCAGVNPGPTAGPSGTPSATVPTLGGEPPTMTRPPSGPMDDLERPIARRLANQVVPQGLTLDYLDCPKWDGEAPQMLRCEAYLDGVVSQVRVRLIRLKPGAVSFDATLQSGIIATKKLVDELVVEGYSDVDCGDLPAYPTKIGSQLVCAVSRGGRDSFVRATVRNESGAVDISTY